MASATLPTPPARLERTAAPPADPCVVIRGIGRAGEETVLGWRGERPRPKIGDLDGDTHLLSPAFPPERWKSRLGLLVMVVTEELDLPCTRLDEVPPPDLVIEVEYTHSADAAIEVWRRFGVPEVWRENGNVLTILNLQPDAQYAESPTSRALPGLAATEIHDWVARVQNDTETAWLKELRRWVSTTLAERYRSWSARREDPETTR